MKVIYINFRNVWILVDLSVVTNQRVNNLFIQIINPISFSCLINTITYNTIRIMKAIVTNDQ